MNSGNERSTSWVLEEADGDFAELIGVNSEATRRVELGVMERRRGCVILRESAVGGRKADCK
ncbi:MAG: hypothetical protein M3R38_29300 [Actinomycetota bacterium]|nr:hypothetical protein [Actinomycetota bacterium]